MFGACAWRIHSYAAIDIWHVPRAAALEAHPFSAANSPAGEKGRAIEQSGHDYSTSITGKRRDGCRSSFWTEAQ